MQSFKSDHAGPLCSMWWHSNYTQRERRVSVFTTLPWNLPISILREPRRHFPGVLLSSTTIGNSQSTPVLYSTRTILTLSDRNCAHMGASKRAVRFAIFVFFFSRDWQLWSSLQAKNPSKLRMCDTGTAPWPVELRTTEAGECGQLALYFLKKTGESGPHMEPKNSIRKGGVEGRWSLPRSGSTPPPHTHTHTPPLFHWGKVSRN